MATHWIIIITALITALITAPLTVLIISMLIISSANDEGFGQ